MTLEEARALAGRPAVYMPSGLDGRPNRMRAEWCRVERVGAEWVFCTFRTYPDRFYEAMVRASDLHHARTLNEGLF